MSKQKQVAVTPPNADTPMIRAWMESEARKQGYTALEWRNERDSNGKPCARLYGVKAAKD